MCPIDFSRSFVKFQGHTGQKNHWFWPELSVSGLQLKFDFTNGFETMHKAWNSIAVVPYYFSRSSVKFQGHTGQKILDFDPNWAFPDCNSNLNSSMALKWSTRLDIIFFLMLFIKFQGHPGWKINNMSPIWVRLLSRLQLSNPSDLPCFVKTAKN